MQTKTVVKPIEVGVFSPTMRITNTLAAGEVGYIATGLKTVSECHVGDTVTRLHHQWMNPYRVTEK